jgi:hypothetical protein
MNTVIEQRLIQQRQCLDAEPAPMAAPDWSRLANMQVEITVDGRPLRRGLVDAVTADGTALWLAMDGALERQLFVRSEGVEAWVRPGPVQALWVMSHPGRSR